MLRYRLTPVEKLKVGDLLDLADDQIVRHPVNSETAVPAMLDRLKHDFVEVLSIDKTSMKVTILTQWGDLSFPVGHTVNVFVEA